MVLMRFILDLLLPPRCPGCHREGHVLCQACEAPLWRRIDEPAGVPVGAPAVLPANLVQLEWCATYSGPIRAALHALKYRGERRLTVPLAGALAARWARVGAGGELLTWVPVHASRLRERGYDQAEELARAAARQLGWPVEAVLERRQRTTAQHTLDQSARASNTASVFGVPDGMVDLVQGRWVVIVDDIVTTGATLSGCAGALLAAGAVAVSGLCVARDR